LNTKIKEYINLPNTYTVENSLEIAQELHKIQIKENYKIVTQDIKDLYVNLLKQGITQSTIFCLDRNNINKKIKKQIIQLLNIIIEQNYFQYNNQFFRPENGIAMGSPISETLAEIYLQQIEELYIKHWIESQEIVYYKRYVDDILIIFDQHRINKTKITSVMNNYNLKPQR
jgi:glycine/serine hydroxymethyltransferase